MSYPVCDLNHWQLLNHMNHCILADRVLPPFTADRELQALASVLGEINSSLKMCVLVPRFLLPWLGLLPHFAPSCDCATSMMQWEFSQ